MTSQRKPEISIIVAHDANLGIGKGGKLLWQIKEDLRHFKNITNGHPILMGRKTFESLPGILPGRTHIIITRNKDFLCPEGTIKASSLDEAIEIASKIDNEEIFIIGGGEIYKEALPISTKLYITRIENGELEADTFFPPYEHAFGKIILREEHEENGLKYCFENRTR